MSEKYRRVARVSRPSQIEADAQPGEPDAEQELQRWKNRASRLRHALLDISAATNDTADDLRVRAADAVNWETGQ